MIRMLFEFALLFLVVCALVVLSIVYPDLAPSCVVGAFLWGAIARGVMEEEE